MGGFYMFSISFKRGIEMKKAIKFLNAMAKYLKKRMKGGVNCEILIGLSDATGKKGRYVAARTGKVGRPCRVYVGTKNAKAIDARELHIHILLHGRNTHYFITLIKEYAKEHRDIVYSYDCENEDYYVGSSIDYVIKQSFKFRYIVGGNGIEAPQRKWILKKYGNIKKKERS